MIKYQATLPVCRLPNNRYRRFAHAVGADVSADVLVDGGRQSQVEEPVGLTSPRQGGEMTTELRERAAVVISAPDVGVLTEEHRQALLLLIGDLTGKFKECVRVQLSATRRMRSTASTFI